MARTLVVSMLKEGNVDYAQKVMTSTFITNIFKQDDGDVFREEIVSSLLIAINNEKPKTAAKAAISAWQKVALNILFSCADCLTWPSQSGVAAEKYLDALFTLCSYEDSEQPVKSVEGTTPTPTTPTPKEDEEEDDDDERMVLLQRVLKHLVVVTLPQVVDASIRLQAIWVLAQFVTSVELQSILLGIVLESLNRKDVEVIIKEDRYARFDHVCLIHSIIHSFTHSFTFRLLLLLLVVLLLKRVPAPRKISSCLTYFSVVFFSL